CAGGTSNGNPCTVAADCPSGTCATAICQGMCAGGANAGGQCTANSGCPGSTCTLGANIGKACTGASGCPSGICVPVNVGKGFDGLPCTDDDPPGSRGVFNTTPTTTGNTLTFISDANDTAGHQLVHKRCTLPTGALCITYIKGSPYDCAKLASGAAGA